MSGRSNRPTPAAGPASGSHSSRGHHHDDLFQPLASTRSGKDLQQSSRGNGGEEKELIDDYTPHIRDQNIHDTYGAGDYQEDPLQLEHVVGFGADCVSNLCSLPLNEYTIAKGSV